MNFTNQPIPLQASEVKAKTGKSLEDLADIVKRTGLTQHMQIRSMFLREYGLCYGEAIALTQEILDKWLAKLPTQAAGESMTETAGTHKALRVHRETDDAAMPAQ